MALAERYDHTPLICVWAHLELNRFRLKKYELPQYCVRTPFIRGWSSSAKSVTRIKMRERGTVRQYDAIKKSGSILRRNKELLVVREDAVFPPLKPLQKGEEVEYEIEQTPEGLFAVDVLPLERYSRYLKNLPQKQQGNLMLQRMTDLFKQKLDDYSSFLEARDTASDQKATLLEEILKILKPDDSRDKDLGQINATVENLIIKFMQTPPEFTISFDPDLSETQIRNAFKALADYYRACGGIGLQVKFEYERPEVREHTRV
jgi:cold shock CspA family protein